MKTSCRRQTDFIMIFVIVTFWLITMATSHNPSCRGSGHGFSSAMQLRRTNTTSHAAQCNDGTLVLFANSPMFAAIPCLHCARVHFFQLYYKTTVHALTRSHVHIHVCITHAVYIYLSMYGYVSIHTQWRMYISPLQYCHVLLPSLLRWLGSGRFLQHVQSEVADRVRARKQVT